MTRSALPVATGVLLLIGACSQPPGRAPNAADICLTPDSDAGPCLADSQCPAGDFCNFGLSSCAFDGGFDGGPDRTVYGATAGSCLPICGSLGSACEVPADCPPANTCINTTVIPPPNGCTPSDRCESITVCSAEKPCPGGKCGRALTGCPAQFCPAGCALVVVPHGVCPACVCPSCTASLDGG